MAVRTSQFQNEVAMTSNLGQTVTTVPTSISNLNQNFRLEIDRNDSLYIINGTDLYKRNGISNWAAIPNAGWTGTDFNIYFDNDNDIYITTGLQATTKGVFYSNTAGSSWVNKSAGLPGYNFAGNNLVTLYDLQFDAQDNVYAYTLDFRPEAATMLGIYKLNVPGTTALTTLNRSETNLHISPNPANKNTVQLWGFGEQLPVAIRIFDNAGRIVRRIENSAQLNATPVIVDLTGIGSGIYFIEAHWKDKNLVGKLIKQ
jgi:hypothetical protein